MEVSCRSFNGYKPCGHSLICDAKCPKLERMDGSILIIHLGAMGAVVRSTALLELIHKKYPRHQLTWVTDAPMQKLLSGHRQIDKVIVADEEGLQEIRGRKFDIALVIDKSARAGGILSSVQVDKVYGFVRDPKFGTIRPANPAAEPLWQLGLSNELKFFGNDKTETQLVAEALELSEFQETPAQRLPEYDLHFTEAELRLAAQRRASFQINNNLPVIGFNTGCGPLMPAKKWTVEFHRQVITELLDMGFKNIVLLGGPDDEIRNKQIAEFLPVIQSPTNLGVRDGAMSIAACDIVITGDSFGMHLAIALKRFVIAWFGPSCEQEIDLYGRGIKLHAEVSCSPCWKRSCNKAVMCHDQVPSSQIQAAVLKAVAIVSPAVLELQSGKNEIGEQADSCGADSLLG